jgi:DNA-binding NarL/FixJ family response regulator
MYKILFIDEEQLAIDDFKDYVEITNTSEEVDVISEYPLSDLDEMISLILKLNPDAIITDFMLNSEKTSISYNVTYTGIELVKEYLEIREGFPCFVMTSFDDDAVKQSEDVNIVYIKNILHNESEKNIKVKANFLDKVITQISHYKKRIENAENRLSELLILRTNGQANIKDEEEIIKLDSFLEKSVDNRSTIPEEYKNLSNTNKLEEIINKVDILLRKIENDNKI